ncbi:MAG: DEAD/DEAH box helicase family protein [Lacticaseibacillus rhamnosus]
MAKQFKLDGRMYEFVTKAEDHSHFQAGEIGIFRLPGTQQYFTMPMSELIARMQDDSADWARRLALFKTRFVNRTDVYAKRYFKDGHKKYSPAGPFEHGRPSLKVHYPLTDDIIRRHLDTKTDFAIGLYPLDAANKTKFLALDVDGHQATQLWQALTTSIVKVCRQNGLSPLIELSQSGHGCHVWLFFDEPIAATDARKLGDALLKATQAIDPRLPFSAFDRLFPAQDQLSAEQLGNLIAAPLEGQGVLAGHTVLVDPLFTPLKDQWQALQAVPLLSLTTVQAVTTKLEQRTGFQFYDSEPSQPDDLFAQGYHIDQPITVIRDSELHLQKSDLSAHDILHLKWLASFRNPEFYQRQANKMPVNLTPRIISLFRETTTELILPRGLQDELAGITAHLHWVERLTPGLPLHLHFNGKLYPNQQKAFAAMTANPTGLLVARTGFGKTVIAVRLIAYFAVSTLILVPNKTLAEQWIASLKDFLTIQDQPVVHEFTPSGRKRHKEPIGTYFGVKKNPSGLIDVATIQAVGKLPDKQEFLNRYGMVISDEAHHNAAVTFDDVIRQVRSKYLYGLSATPQRRDGQDPILGLRFGPIRFKTEVVDPKYLETVQRTVIPRLTNLGMTTMEILQNGFSENQTAMMNDPDRDQLILRDIRHCLKDGRHILVLTRRREHVDQLYRHLPKTHVYRLYGKFSSK